MGFPTVWFFSAIICSADVAYGRTECSSSASDNQLPINCPEESDSIKSNCCKVDEGFECCDEEEFRLHNGGDYNKDHATNPIKRRSKRGVFDYLKKKLNNTITEYIPTDKLKELPNKVGALTDYIPTDELKDLPNKVGALADYIPTDELKDLPNKVGALAEYIPTDELKDLPNKVGALTDYIPTDELKDLPNKVGALAEYIPTDKLKELPNKVGALTKYIRPDTITDLPKKIRGKVFGYALDLVSGPAKSIIVGVSVGIFLLLVISIILCCSCCVCCPCFRLCHPSLKKSDSIIL